MTQFSKVSPCHMQGIFRGRRNVQLELARSCPPSKTQGQIVGAKSKLAKITRRTGSLVNFASPISPEKSSPRPVYLIIASNSQLIV